MVKVKINGQETTEVHYWNKIDGIEIDLSSSQYGGDGLNTLSSSINIGKTVESNGVTIEFLGIASQEIRDKVTHSDRFDLLERNLSRA